MIWFFIEMGVALLLLILIVWWTMPRRGTARDDDLGGERSTPAKAPPGDPALGGRQPGDRPPGE